MEWADIIKVGIGLLGGSLIGTLVKIAYDRWREGVPSVAYHVEQDKVFSADSTDKMLQATLVTTTDNETVSFRNLSLVKVVIRNTTGKDFDTLGFGVTIPDPHEIVRVEYTSKDRLHQVTPTQNPSPIATVTELDFSCTPFNRNDEYVAKLYVHSADAHLSIENVTVQTAASVSLVKRQEDPIARRRIYDLATSVIGMLLSVLAFFLFLRSNVFHNDNPVPMIYHDPASVKGLTYESVSKRLDRIEAEVQRQELLRKSKPPKDVTSDNGADRVP